MVAGWRAHRWQWYLATHTRAQRPYAFLLFFFFYAFEQSSADTVRRRRDGVLILSCFSSDARFMYDFFASIGGSVEAELCSLIFLGRLIFAVVAVAAALA